MNELPESIRKMLDGGWHFEWEPETRFLGAYHRMGGKVSVIEIRLGRFDDLGEWIAAAIAKQEQKKA